MKLEEKRLIWMILFQLSLLRRPNLNRVPRDLSIPEESNPIINW
jgi:hypothetical protein